MKSSTKVDKRLRKLVFEYAQKHAWRMGVSNYLMDVMWMDNDGETKDGYDPPYAEMTVDRRYLKAILKVYPSCVREWKKRGDEFLETTVAHEIAHILTVHMMELATAPYKSEDETKDAWESLTESISRLSMEISK